MKKFQAPEGVQTHLDLFTLRQNFRVFSRGKRKGYSLIQREGLNVSLNDWSDLLYSGGKVMPEEALFLSGKVKEPILVQQNLPAIIISSLAKGKAKNKAGRR